MKKAPYVLDGREIPSVTQILRFAGLDPYRHVSGSVLERACLRGSAVHLITQLHDEQDLHLPSVHPALVGFLDSWCRFLEHARWTPLEIERRMVNRAYRYGGTPDRFGLLNDAPTVLDLKSGPLARVTALQTAGYAHRPDEYPRDTVRRLAIRLKADGSMPTVKEYTDPGELGIFLGLVGIAHWRMNGGELPPESAEADELEEIA